MKGLTPLTAYWYCLELIEMPVCHTFYRDEPFDLARESSEDAKVIDTSSAPISSPFWDSFWWGNAMVLINSPNRRPQTAFSSPSFRKQHTKGDELGSFTTVIRRHRFLLTALALLAFLCTIYLYFAVTLGEDNNDTCSGLTGTQKALCQAQHVKQTVAKGKMKIL
ncbi:hypothetical protein L1887_20058 [Cichorium endivia]|nr:hypothetical protein L1887_20058 [Cichorium endivia]